MGRSAGGWEVVVVGAGPVGLTAAVALGLSGVETALIAPRAATTDNRTSGLLVGSVVALETLGVWSLCRRHAVALHAVRIIEGRARLLRAREVVFRAADIGLDAFGYNLENRYLLAALERRASGLPALTRIEDQVSSVSLGDSAIEVGLGGGGRARARLVIGADGQGSFCRRAVGIDVDGWRYPQTAIALCFGHTEPHHDTSIEFHIDNEPLTLMPLPGTRSSLVLAAETQMVARLGALNGALLAEELERRSRSMLGRISVEPGHGTFPIAMQTARRFAADRVALIGEAAHVIPPFGGHGLNLGLRDAATIAELMVAARRAGRDLGSAEVLASYDALRRPDVVYLRRTIGFATELLLSDAVAVRWLRGLTHLFLHGIGPLRRTVMRKGIGPGSWTPALMRGEQIG